MRVFINKMCDSLANMLEDDSFKIVQAMLIYCAFTKPTYSRYVLHTWYDLLLCFLAFSNLQGSLTDINTYMKPRKYIHVVLNMTSWEWYIVLTHRNKIDETAANMMLNWFK